MYSGNAPYYNTKGNWTIPDDDDTPSWRNLWMGIIVINTNAFVYVRKPKPNIFIFRHWDIVQCRKINCSVFVVSFGECLVSIVVDMMMMDDDPAKLSGAL